MASERTRKSALGKRIRVLSFRRKARNRRRKTTTIIRVNDVGATTDGENPNRTARRTAERVPMNVENGRH